MRGTQTLELMLRCLSNIDEEVLYHACLALYALIQRSPPARILFLRKQGIAELAECLRDYNTDVKATSLRILCLLAAESDHAREEMRTEEVRARHSTHGAIVPGRGRDAACVSTRRSRRLRTSSSPLALTRTTSAPSLVLSRSPLRAAALCRPPARAHAAALAAP